MPARGLAPVCQVVARNCPLIETTPIGDGELMPKPSALSASMTEHAPRHQQDHLQSGSEEKRQPVSRLGSKSIKHFLGLHPAIRPPMQSDETLSVSPHRFLPGILTTYVPSKGSSET